MKLTPKQLGIVAAMDAIKDIHEEPMSRINLSLGVAKLRGVRKELALIHNRLGKRLPKNIPWTELSIDSEE